MGRFCCSLFSCYCCAGGSPQQSAQLPQPEPQEPEPGQEAVPNNWNQIVANPGLTKADLISIRDSIKQTVSVVKRGTGSSSSSSNSMSANANDLFQAAPQFLNAISEEAGRAQDGLKQIDQDDDLMALRILPNILEALGALHWVASCLSLVAYLLKKMIVRIKMKEEATTLLDEMVDLASELVEKFEHFSPDNKTFKKAIGIIIDGTISCCDAIPTSMTRFLQADADANLLINIRQKMISIKMDIISQCVGEILNRIPKSYQPNELGQPSGKGDKRVEEVMALLSVGGSTLHPPRALIIHGIGGIGKTTLLDKVRSTLLEPPRGQSFKYANISLPLEDPNPITHWQQVLYEVLTGKVMKFIDEKQGQGEILRELKKFRQPILLSIDNASEEFQLDLLLPEELNQLPFGSLILITSRNVGVKNKLKDKGIHEVKEYPVEKLPEEDSRNILEKMIGEQIMKEIVEKDIVSLLKGCDGHPLALTIVGKFIRHEVEDHASPQVDSVSPQEACKYVLESFKHHPDDEGDRIGGKELFRALDYSINHLPDDSKTTFFDIVVFFNMSDEFTWDEVKAIYDPIAFKRLKYRSLINKRDNKVQVHDQLCSLARRQMSKCAIRIKGWKELEPLINRQQDIEPRFKFPTLRHLRLSNCITSSMTLPKKGIAELKCLKTLQIECCKGLKTLPQDLWNLDSLQQLDLFICESLEALPPIKGMAQSCRIQTICLSGCVELKTLPEDLWSLTSLEHLNLVRCKSLEALPPIKDMAKSCCIQALDLLECTGLKTLPDDLWSLTALQHLGLRDCKSLEALPPIKDMEKSCCIQALDLLECTGLKTLPDDFWSLTALQHLGLRDCKSLEALPPIKGMGKSCYIQTLDLSSCIALKTLVEDLWSLTSLQQLNLSGCENLEALPPIRGMGKFCHIQKIRLSDCTGLKTLPENLWTLTSLQSLNLAGCESLETLPPIKGLEQSCCIQVLGLSKCKGLKTLPEDIWSLTSLQKLDLSHCESLESLPPMKGMGHSCSIQIIRLSGCTALKTLPNDLQSLTSLKELHLEDCSESVLEGTSHWVRDNIVV